MVKMLWLLYPLHGCLSCSITSGMLCIVGERESAHIILRYVQCRLHILDSTIVCVYTGNFHILNFSQIS